MLSTVLTAKDDVIAGKYRVERLIDVGGRGQVMEATQIDLGTRVALRIMGPFYAWSSEESARLRAVAPVAALLNGERAERMIDAGALESGDPFMVTTFLEGLDLATELKRRGALAPEQAVDFVIQACEALADSHAAGVLHCDLRPAKLFVSERDGAPFVTVLQSLIPVQAPLGLSPAASSKLDRRTDVYSLGMTLCELLAGKLPFEHMEHTSPSGRRTVETKYIPLRTLCPSLPTDLVAVVERAFSRDRNARFDSMTAFAIALSPFAPRRSQAVVERLAAR